MEKDKQIEEMARVIGTVPPVEIYGGRGHGKKVFFTTHIAEHLYINGYRKAYDIAREIFEEIEKKVNRSIVIYLEEMNKEHIIDTPLYDRCSGSVFAFQNMADFIAELKKKYGG